MALEIFRCLCYSVLTESRTTTIKGSYSMGADTKERGSISIPQKEWSKFKKNLIKNWNDARQSVINDAKSIQEDTKTYFKGKRGVSHTDVTIEIETKYDANEAMYMALYSLKNDGYKMMAISEARANEWVPKANSKTRCFQTNLIEFSFSIDDETRTAHWFVDYNSNAVEIAHKNVMACAIFKSLKAVEYGKLHGGCFYGNDEYNMYDGTGEEYITATYGAGEDATR